MSHLSKVQVAIRDIDVLGEALRAIGLRRVAEVPETTSLPGPSIPAMSSPSMPSTALWLSNLWMARPSSIPISNPAISKDPG